MPFMYMLMYSARRILLLINVVLNFTIFHFTFLFDLILLGFISFCHFTQYYKFCSLLPLHAKRKWNGEYVWRSAWAASVLAPSNRWSATDFSQFWFSLFLHPLFTFTLAACTFCGFLLMLKPCHLFACFDKSSFAFLPCHRFPQWARMGFCFRLCNISLSPFRAFLASFLFLLTFFLNQIIIWRNCVCLHCHRVSIIDFHLAPFLINFSLDILTMN